MESVLSVRGNATIPKAIREHLHLEAGDRIKFSRCHPPIRYLPASLNVRMNHKRVDTTVSDSPPPLLDGCVQLGS